MASVHRRREVGLTNDYPRLDESLSVLVERFQSLQPLAGAEFLNNGTLSFYEGGQQVKTRQGLPCLASVAHAVIHRLEGRN